MVNTRLQDHDAPSTTRAIKDTANKLGVSINSLTRWCNNAILDIGKEFTSTNDINAEIRRLKRENAELRRTNKILKTASAYSVRRTRPSDQQMMSFNDTYKNIYGVEPI